MNTSKNFEAGRRAEMIALEILRRRNVVEDRTEWALDPEKPYSMDFYWPKLRIAADFKYKTLNPRYNSFYLEEGHYDKYVKYIAESDEVDAGYLWYVDRNTDQEYLVDMAQLVAKVTLGTVKKYFNKRYKQDWESGYFYAIPVEFFTNITDRPFSINSILNEKK